MFSLVPFRHLLRFLSQSPPSPMCALLVRPFVGFDERVVHDSSKYFFNDRSILKNNNNKLLRLPRPPSQPQYSKPTHHITPFFVLMKTNGEKELLTVLFQGRTEMNARTWSLFLSGSEFAVRNPCHYSQDVFRGENLGNPPARMAIWQQPPFSFQRSLT